MLNHGIVPASGGDYEIDNSLRFNDNDSAYLSRTPSSAGNRKTWTWSGWVKRGNLGTVQSLFSTSRDGSAIADITFRADDKIDFMDYVSGYRYRLITTQLFRDVSSWYHFVAVSDTSNSTSSNRVVLYVNGERVTAFDTATYPTQNLDGDFNDSNEHRVAREGRYTSYLDGYLAEVNFVDGQALTPADFGETDEDYGHWKPIEYEGTYGTNGFYLDFSNSGSLGTDASSNSNNWTPNNLSATDQMLDSPTNNFCTLNPLDKESLTLSEGNLQTSAEASDDNVRATISQSAGKWYWESIETSTIQSHLGILDVSNDIYSLGYMGSTADSWGIYTPNGNKRNNGSYVSYGSALATDDVLMTAVDLDSGKIWWGKNGTWFASGNPSSGTNAAFTNVSGEVSPAVTSFRANVLNFGQDSSFAGNKTAQGNQDSNGIGDFYYTPPSGYLALCTQNLPEPTVVPSEHFNTVLYTGNGYPTSNTQSVTGIGFQPDWTWIKVRDNPNNHRLFDVVRGVTKDLISNSTGAEEDVSRLTSFDSDGFTTSNNSEVNREGNDIVAWNWKANGTGVSNTDGSITSTVSANQDAGFSIVSYTGTGSTATVGHGLSKKPQALIIKNRTDGDSSSHWLNYFESETAFKRLMLNSTSASESHSVHFNNTEPTSSVFTINTSNAGNGSSDTFIAYCFHSVDGYSKVGSYTGNGSSSDGTFVYTGFRPKYVLIKSVNTQSWNITDTARLNYNLNDLRLLANSSGAEEDRGASDGIDMLSNGFKLRSTATIINSANNFIYIAFAETPFKYSNAR